MRAGIAEAQYGLVVHDDIGRTLYSRADHAMRATLFAVAVRGTHGLIVDSGYAWHKGFLINRDAFTVNTLTLGKLFRHRLFLVFKLINYLSLNNVVSAVS